jgi:1-acyl-sn-glycerol-3-phosphate acyltransferase
MKSVGVLAERAAVPIVPVLIQGAYEVWPKGQGIPHLGRISLVFGKPLKPENTTGEGIRDAVVGLKGELSGCRIGSL